MLKLSLHPGQKIRVSINPVSLTGKNLVRPGQTPSMKTRPASSALLPTDGVISGEELKLDGKPTWTADDGDGSVDVAEDGLSAWIVAGDQFGVTIFSVEANIELGTGFEKVTAPIQLTTEDPLSAHLGLQAGTPTPQ